MTDRQAELLLLNRFQQLEIIQQELDEFEERDGKKGVEQRIDDILDEIIYLQKFIKNSKDESKGKN